MSIYRLQQLQIRLQHLGSEETALQELKDQVLADIDRQLLPIVEESRKLRRELKALKADLDLHYERVNRAEGQRQGRRPTYPWYLLQQAGDFFTIPDKTAADLRPLAAHYQAKLEGTAILRCNDYPGGVMVSLVFWDHSPTELEPPPQVPVPEVEEREVDEPTADVGDNTPAWDDQLVSNDA